MASPAQLYDRKAILEAVERDCLGDPGVSGVIVGAQKVGKTALLSHVSRLVAGHTESLFCRVNIDDLEAWGFTDDAFLRLFLDDLQQTVTENVAVLATRETSLKEGLAATEARGDLGGQADKIRASLDELVKLRQMNEQIEKLLDRADPLEPADTHRIFGVLPKMRKRVVLIIDEFHRMMPQANFSNKLWAFLRGASTQGKILTIVSSRVHLMDASLHGTQVEKTYDRLNLFNHYQTQFLQPFNRDEARGFLDWLGPVDPPLTDSEQDYICELGGGSPHFLKRAWELFLRYRPDSIERRSEFERSIALPEFDPDFTLMWGGFSAGERNALNDVASAGACSDLASDKLEREGYVTKAEGCSRLFSKLFQRFVQREWNRQRRPITVPTQPAARPVAVRRLTVKPIEPLTRNFASAMGLACPEEARVFKVVVENLTGETIRVVVACEVLNYSDLTKRAFDVKPGSETLYGCAVFKGDALRNLPDAAPVNVNWSVSHIKGGKPREIESGQYSVQLLPPNHFPVALWDGEAQALSNQTWLIAAWVRRRGLNFQQLLNAASGEYTLTGYDAPEGSGRKEHARKQVEALYNAVKKRKLIFRNSASVILSDRTQYVQQVRLPEETLEEGAGNCLDMAVLFASMMLMCPIEPLILFLPRHAIVGWRDGEDGFDFIQTTGIEMRTFAEALAEGNALFDRNSEACRESLETPPGTIANPSDFAILVDITKTVESRGLSKL